MTGAGSTRDHLIESTQELLWERGYAATSPRAILDRAGAGQGSMYHHFRGKEDLAAAAMAATAQQLLARAEAALTGEGSAFERLAGYLLRQREVLRGCPVGRMTGDADVLESAVLRRLVATTFDSLRAHVDAVVRAGVRDGEFDSAVDPAELADTVLAVVQGGYVLARAAGDPAPFDRAVRGAVAMLDHLRRKDTV
ncbi:TetR/AcrR family transcriptional regulator [Actinoplanes teichomyceticus]|uniref:TetR family transcriptional regulator n=1 Tax=Actinoplanes teichomyceticus TaxID=1867 RepID=A0A561VCJ2_ACTTI|nr:TetR/AcrR family transcriptional regulator [Actinoplanes teichomyceticus]TWG09329.1 TetR family transcriptional regulator [Actinoplanes teichomyceticus]GIF16647.1 TetR family transcriptional regulator [Actinoplanes teichomyceticus]